MQNNAMQPRDRVLTALRRQLPDRVPKHMYCSAGFLDKLQAEIGTRDFVTHFGLEMRTAPFEADSDVPDVQPYFGTLPEGATVNPWGVVHVPGQHGHGKRLSPMRRLCDVSQIDDYPFPEFRPRMESMRQRVRAIHGAGYAAFSSYQNGPLEQAQGLRGMEEFSLDLAANKPFAAALLDRITAVKVQVLKAHADAGVDLIWLGDDVGMQDRLLLAPETWRELVKPHLVTLIEAIRSASAEVIIAYHSDGHVEPLVGELVEAGVQVLQAVQPECNDVARLKREHGRHLGFWGTVGCQGALSRGTPEDVRREVRTRIETVGRSGGLLIAPTQRVEVDVPVENVLAFFAAVEEFGG